MGYFRSIGGRCCDACLSDPCLGKPLTLTPSSVSCTSGAGCTFFIMVATGGAATSYACTGLPGDWTLNTSTGRAHSDNPAAGSYPLTISATNACGTASRNINMAVSGGCTCEFSGIIAPHSTVWAQEVIDDAYDVTGEFPCTQSVSITWSYSGDIEDFYLRIETPAAGTVLFSTYSLYGSTTFNVPAGTTELNIHITYNFTNSTDSAMSGSVTLACP
jgi:hypothetical protein